jgi:hypothetical protein
MGRREKSGRRRALVSTGSGAMRETNGEIADLSSNYRQKASFWQCTYRPAGEGGRNASRDLQTKTARIP